MFFLDMSINWNCMHNMANILYPQTMTSLLITTLPLTLVSSLTPWLGYGTFSVSDCVVVASARV